MVESREEQHYRNSNIACKVVVLAFTLAGYSMFGRIASAQDLLSEYSAPGGTGGGIAFQPLLSRDAPQYEGVRVGNTVIRPELDESTGYDSNILGTARPHGSPLITTNASLNAASDFSLSRIQAAISVNDNRYPSQPSQSTTNWMAVVSGSHEFGQDLATASFSHQALTLTNQNLDVPQLQTPIMYTIDDGQLIYRINLGRTFVSPAIDVSSYNYGANSIVQGSNYTQNYLDRVEVSPGLTAGYELSPGRTAIVVVHEADAIYSGRMAGIAPQDYNDVAVLAGLNYEANGLIRYRALTGYEVRTFRSEQYKTIQAPIVEASAIWTPTGLTTVSGFAGRRIQDSANTAVASYTTNYLRLQVDHSYLRYVQLRAYAGATFLSYQGGSNQSQYTFGASVNYVMNRNVGLSLNYDFSSRTSSGNANLGVTRDPFGNNETDSRIALQLRLRL